jgi:uncharacterized membrane protein YhiD involved in acid resistance
MVSTLGNIIHINQQAHSIVNEAGSSLFKESLQNSISAQLVNNKFKHIQRVRPIEDSHKIDSDSKHKEKKEEQEQENMKNSAQKHSENQPEEIENEQNDIEQTDNAHLLDIKT